MAGKTNTTINGHYEYYRITRTIGHDSAGRPIKKQFCGKSKGDAERRYDNFLKEQARLKYEGEQILNTTTLHDRAIEYIENTLNVSQKYSNGTKIRYKSAYNCHIKDTWLDKMVVKDIHPSDLQRFYNQLDVSISTLKQVNRFMSTFFKWMLRNEYSNDLTAAIELPVKRDTKKSETIVIWDDDSWNLLTSQNFDFRHDLLIKLLCYSGMRIGECLGLKYGDIKGDIIHINRQYSMGEIKAPKYNSKRDIPMHDKVKEALEIHRKWHKQEMIDRDYNTEYIFTTNSGKLIEPSNLATAFNRFYKRIGITPQNFHIYRATFCTKLCESGVPLEVASKLLGHKSLEVTAKHYALVRQDSKIDAINKLK